MFFGVSVLIAVLTLCVGYFTLVKAAGQQGMLATLGKVIGWATIVLAIGGLLCAGGNINKADRYHRGGCPRKAGYCPAEQQKPCQAPIAEEKAK